MSPPPGRAQHAGANRGMEYRLPLGDRRAGKDYEVEIRSRPPSVKGPAEIFTGDVWYDVIARGEEPSRVRVNVVRFAPGARTAWHSHAVGQTFYVTEGRGLVQSRGSQVTSVRPGDVIYTPPGEWHWHGAAADHFMTHLAIWEAPAAGAESDWSAHVTDAEYGSAPATGES